MATVYLLCGLPTSGKTTLARKLEREKKAVRFTLDERMIVKYNLTIFDEAYGQLANEEKYLIWGEAQHLLATGKNVILDWSLWNRNARHEWTQKVLDAGYSYELIYLQVPIIALRQRLADRNEKNITTVHYISIKELNRFSQIFEAPSADEDLTLTVIDSESRT